MKYKVGDKVKVRSDLVKGKGYGLYKFISDMTQFLGKDVEISDTVFDFYYLKEDSKNRAWTDEMFEGLVEEAKQEKTFDNLKVGDILVDNNDLYKKVLGVCGLVYILSNASSDLGDKTLKESGDWYTVFELMHYNYSIYNPEGVKTKLTKQEIADKFDVDINDLEIVE